MAQFYTLTEVSQLGEPWFPSEPGAKGIQNYWCKVEGEEWNVMIGKQVREDGTPAIAVGDQLYGDLMKKVSGSGNNYWKFKSEKTPDGTPRPAQAPRTPAQATAQQAVGGQVPAWFVPFANQMTSIQKTVEAIAKDTGIQVYEEQRKALKDPEPTPGDTTPLVDEKTQADLKEIFG